MNDERGTMKYFSVLARHVAACVRPARAQSRSGILPLSRRRGKAERLVYVGHACHASARPEGTFGNSPATCPPKEDLSPGPGPANGYPSPGGTAEELEAWSGLREEAHGYDKDRRQ